MDILHIRYFSTVYETLNYAQAAEQLYVSRQALRKVVHTLEREVGQPLFQNVSNHLQATPAADRLYQISREAVRGFSVLEDGLASMKLAREGILRVGMGHDHGAVFSRSEYEAFHSLPDDRHPVNPARMRFRSGSKDELSRLLLHGDLDYAHVVGCVFDRRLFDCQVARTGRLHLVVHEADPLASKDQVCVAGAHQEVRLGHVGDVGRGDLDGVDQARVGVHADVRLVAEVPGVALLALMGLRVPGALPVLGRRGGLDEGRVDDGAPGDRRAALGERGVDLVEDTRAEASLLEEVPELAQGRLVGRVALPEADERPDRGRVVALVLAGAVGEVVDHRHQVHAQHRGQGHRGPAGPPRPLLEVERGHEALEPAPGHRLPQLRQEGAPAGQRGLPLELLVEQGGLASGHLWPPKGRLLYPAIIPKPQVDIFICLHCRALHAVSAGKGLIRVSLDDLARCKVSLPTEGNDITELLTAQARLHGFELDVVRYDPSLHYRLSDAQNGHAACVGYLGTRYPRVAPNTASIPFAEEFMTWSYCVLAKRGMGDPLVMRYFAGLEIDWDGYIRTLHASQKQEGRGSSRSLNRSPRLPNGAPPSRWQPAAPPGQRKPSGARRRPLVG